ncbi:type IV pilin [Halorarius litoreus]|uniref:type IV pilin n=1 Tax=Halorarius litoreus TaxID=2962676 RepID=UPI0020CD906D|nr:type IV pilin [Halorarius litoreus]
MGRGTDTTSGDALRSSNRAVSPVIAVVMMVAVTVILAAVVTAAVFVTGDVETAQQAATRFDNIVASFGALLP